MSFKRRTIKNYLSQRKFIFADDKIGGQNSLVSLLMGGMAVKSSRLSGQKRSSRVKGEAKSTNGMARNWATEIVHAE